MEILGRKNTISEIKTSPDWWAQVQNKMTEEKSVNLYIDQAENRQNKKI